MSQNQATATAPVTEANVQSAVLFDGVVKAIRAAERFPSVIEIAEAVMSGGFQVPDGKGPSYVANKVANLVDNGELDDYLRAKAQDHRPDVKRKALHDKHGHVKAADKLGRKGHRELRLGLILRNGKGFRVCGKTTKDLSEAQRAAIYQMRRKGASWGEITEAHKLEYNHGMTARNIFLAVLRAKAK
jgi:hypothetical protein